LTARTLPALNPDEAERDQLFDAPLDGIDALLGSDAKRSCVGQQIPC
jgi:hypothetical protein